MKTILCYGDSNTFGWDPESMTRLAPGTRWPGVVQERLGDAYHLIEEGLPGRTTVWADPSMGLISGADYLYPCLFSHQPMDMVVLMLGTNDTKPMFGATPVDISRGMERIIRIIAAFRSEFMPAPPQVLLIAPAPVRAPKDRFAQMFAGAEAKSAALGALYRDLAAAHGTLFLDAGAWVEPSTADGVHLNAKSHRVLGQAIAEVLAKAL